jgi:cytochrome b561
MTRRRFMISFHWLTVTLVAAAFGLAWYRNGLDDLAARAFWLDVHRVIGLSILAITTVRLAMRWGAGPVSARGDLPLGMWMASRATHLIIYALLLAMPIVGWANSSASARHLKIFGYPFPALLHRNLDLADRLHSWHEQLGWVLLGVIGLHASAALFHHFVLRDNVLKAMLPGGSPPTLAASERA